jgi:hypothetical protein
MIMLARRLLPLLILFASLGALPAEARAPALSLGEVTLSPEAPPHYRKLLMDTLSAELASAKLAHKRAESFVVHARLAQLKTQRSRPVQSQATVALVLTRAESGAMFAMVEGRVLVKGYLPEHAEAMAVQAAAKSALKRVESALR